MKHVFFSVMSALMVCVSSVCGAENEAQPEAKAADHGAEIKKQLDQIVNEIKGKLGQGVRTEEELKAEIAKFDKLLADHKGEQSGELADVLMMKALL